MKVLSIANTGEGLSKKTIERGGGFITTRFTESKIGKEYNVYGINIWKSTLNYLIMDTLDKPFWYPADLFTIQDNTLPSLWYFNQFGDKYDYSLEAIWGYKELALDLSHYEGIMEREPEHIELFMKNKKLIDEELEYYKLAKQND